MGKLGRTVKYGLAMLLAFKMGSCYGEYKTVKEYKMRNQSNVVGEILDNHNNLESKLINYKIIKS
ncbi:MAG: hypothetical protein PHE43_01815 [Candidatus Nanoarchaeia archaeon]|nr:hypothetical protein [Candidatus Nanoarchaeia archaeon]